MKALLFLIIINTLPFNAVEPHLKIKGDSIFIEFHTLNPSTDPNVFYGEIPYPETPRPFYLDFDRNVWSKKVDTVHCLKLYKVRPGVLYHYMVSYIDTVKKLECASKEYFFRVVKDKDGHLREGLVITDGPYLAIFSEDDYAIYFSTNFECKAEVELNGIRIKDNRSSKRHEIFLDDLKEGEKIYRVIVYTDADTFATPFFKFRVKTGNRNIRFLVSGDSRASWRYPASSYRINGVNYNILRLLMMKAYEEDVDFVVLVGDLISGYTQSEEYAELQYRTYLMAMWPFNAFIPVLHVAGNHDMTAPYMKKDTIRFDPPPPNSAEDLWARIFVSPENGPKEEKGNPPYKETVYFLDIGNSRLVVLNTDYNFAKAKRTKISEYIDDIQLKWLDRVLKKNKKDHTFIFFHEPAFPVGPHREGVNDKNKNSRDSLWNILQEYNPDAVFVGHEHFYARVLTPGNIWQIITGRAGAPLYGIYPEDIPDEIKLVKFTPEFHYVIVETGEKESYMKVYTFPGDIIDSLELK